MRKGVHLIFVWLLLSYPRPGRDADHSPPSSAEVVNE
jgi:hypothetical protein